MLGNNDCCAPFIQFGNDGVVVERLVGDEGIEFETVNQRWYFHTVEALSGHQTETHEIAQGIRQRKNLRRHAAFRAANGLALRPPFAP